NYYLLTISSRDIIAFIIVTIYLNLYIRTITKFLRKRLNFITTLKKLLVFKAYREFILIEVGYSLDTRNLETTIIIKANGSFTLNTPNVSIAKAILLSLLLISIARVTIIFT
ncbi:hypothetical protein CTAM01_13728, partial [Colletotrichum tamarilloi]